MLRSHVHRVHHVVPILTLTSNVRSRSSSSQGSVFVGVVLAVRSFPDRAAAIADIHGEWEGIEIGGRVGNPKGSAIFRLSSRWTLSKSKLSSLPVPYDTHTFLHSENWGDGAAVSNSGPTSRCSSPPPHAR